MAAARPSDLRNLVEAVPYAIQIVLTDNGIQFTNRACDPYAFHHTSTESATKTASNIG